MSFAFWGDADPAARLSALGMPTGSPGMEYGNRREAYKVMTFGPAGQRVYASYAASGGAHAH